MHGLKGYAKFDGMTLAQAYLPQQVVFGRREIIRTPEEWEKVADEYDANLMYRVDVPQGTVRPSIICSGWAKDIPKCLAVAQSIASNAVLILMQPRLPVVPRYLYQGGFCVDFDVGNQIEVRLSGKGFDGHELTREGMEHERITIPWRKVKVNAMQWKEMFGSSYYRIDLVEYLHQQAERVNALHRAYGIGVTELEAAIPLDFTPLIPSALVQSLQQLVIAPLMMQQNKFYQDGLMRFSVLGNFANNIPQVWEILRP